MRGYERDALVRAADGAGGDDDGDIIARLARKSSSRQVQAKRALQDEMAGLERFDDVTRAVDGSSDDEALAGLGGAARRATVSSVVSSLGGGKRRRDPMESALDEAEQEWAAVDDARAARQAAKRARREAKEASRASAERAAAEEIRARAAAAAAAEEEALAEAGGRRRVSKDIVKNRGVESGKGRSSSNPRKARRDRYDKKVKKAASGVRSAKAGQSLGYGGESSGINPNVSHSRRL
jgi:hypothetical protein